MLIIRKITLLLFGLIFMASNTTIAHKSKQLAVFTDYEADDAVALALLLEFGNDNLIKQDNFLIGTLLSNQYRKKALAQELVTLFGYNPQNVYAGTGGIKDPFEEEGRNILPSETLQELKKFDKKYLEFAPGEYQDKELSEKFTSFLDKAEVNSVDILLLTNPIDFVKVFAQNKDNFCKINKIYMMGGWFANKPSFNWSLHIESIESLLNLMKDMKGKPNSPELILFSSHFFAHEFNGYVNKDKFPEVIEAFDKNQAPIVNHLRNMVKNWDDSMTVIRDYHNEKEKKWRLGMVERIGKENIGRQFAPADPATVIGYLYPDSFIIEKKPTNINLHFFVNTKGEKDSTIDAQYDLSSNVFVVEKVDLKFFNDKLVELMNINS